MSATEILLPEIQVPISCIWDFDQGSASEIFIPLPLFFLKKIREQICLCYEYEISLSQNAFVVCILP